MKDGWCEGLYWILFDDGESEFYGKSYMVDRYLPGYKILGLLGWDDFIMTDHKSIYLVPTVPFNAKYSKVMAVKLPSTLEYDKVYTGKVKWYINPIILGGSPTDKNNIAFIEFDKHAELVVWWNDKIKTFIK